MYELSIPRITRMTYGLGAAGALITLALYGAPSAVGFAIGAALSLVSVRSWSRLAEALGGGADGAPKRPAAAAMVFMMLRYLLIAGAAYVSMKYLGSAPAAVLVGLLISFAAVVLDLLFGTVLSK